MPFNAGLTMAEVAMMAMRAETVKAANERGRTGTQKHLKQLIAASLLSEMLILIVLLVLIFVNLA